MGGGEGKGGEEHGGASVPPSPKNEFWEQKRERGVREREREREKKMDRCTLGSAFSQFDPISLELRQTKSFNAIELWAHF